MESLRKGPRLTTRYSGEQLERLGLAACVASRRALEEIDDSTLSRQFTNRGVEDLLGAATPAEMTQARLDLEERRRKAKASRRESKTRQGDRRTGERRRAVATKS